MRPSTAALTPFGYAAAAVLLWPLVEIVGGQLGARHHEVQVVWLRYAVHLGLLVAYCGVRGHWHAFATRRPVLQLARGACMFGMPVAFLLARDTGPGTWAWTVFWLGPLLVLGAAPLVGERARPVHFAAAAIGWLGAVAVLRPAAGGLTSTALALAMAATFAGYVLASRALARESMAANLFYTAVGAGLPMTPLALRAWTPISATDVVPGILLGASSIAFLFALDRAIERGPMVAVTPALVAVVAWESLLRGGLPHGAAVLGFVVIAVAVLLPQHLRRAEGVAG